MNTEDNADHKVMQQATLINKNLNDMNQNRRTALERSVINYRGGLKLRVWRVQTSPSVTDVEQTFSWLFGSHA